MNMYLHCCCFWRSFCGENHALFCLFSTLIIIDQYSADTYVHVYVRTYVHACIRAYLYVQPFFHHFLTYSMRYILLLRLLWCVKGM